MEENKDKKTLDEAIGDSIGEGCPYSKESCYGILGINSPCVVSSEYKKCPNYICKVNKIEFIYD
jgi:hypothetical protein